MLFQLYNRDYCLLKLKLQRKLNAIKNHITVCSHSNRGNRWLLLSLFMVKKGGSIWLLLPAVLSLMGFVWL